MIHTMWGFNHQIQNVGNSIETDDLSGSINKLQRGKGGGGGRAYSLKETRKTLTKYKVWISFNTDWIFDDTMKVVLSFSVSDIMVIPNT